MCNYLYFLKKIDICSQYIQAILKKSTHLNLFISLVPSILERTHKNQIKMKTKVFYSIVAILIAIAIFPANAQNDSVIEKITEKQVISENSGLTEFQKDSIAYSKLSADQIMKLKEQEAIAELARIDADSREDMPLNGFGIVVITMMPFVFVILLIYFVNKSKERESIRKYELYTKSLEMGQTIPEHFFDEPKKKSQSSSLKTGVIALMVGIALIIVAIMKHDLGGFFFVAGIIPALVGIGYIVVHFLEKPKKDNLAKQNE